MMLRYICYAGCPKRDDLDWGGNQRKQSTTRRNFTEVSAWRVDNFTLTLRSQKTLFNIWIHHVSSPSALSLHTISRLANPRTRIACSKDGRASNMAAYTRSPPHGSWHPTCGGTSRGKRTACCQSSTTWNRSLYFRHVYHKGGVLSAWHHRVPLRLNPLIIIYFSHWNRIAQDQSHSTR